MTLGWDAEPDSGRPRSLPILDGPWKEEVWRIERPVRLEISGEIECAVATCNLPAGRAPGQKSRKTDVLCLAHTRRFAKSKLWQDVESFVADQSMAKPILAPRGAVNRLTHFPAIDFTVAPESLAEELRYLAGIKIARNHWTSPEYVSQVVGTAVHIGESTGIESLFDLPTSGLASFASSGTNIVGPNPHGITGYRSLELALPDMLRRLLDAKEDPWEQMIWHAAELRIPEQGAKHLRNVSWKRVTCDWLREGVKALSKSLLQSGHRSWSTINTYSTAAALLSRFMESETGPITPPDLTRQVYLEFLAWVRDENSTTTDLRAVNTLARLLGEMREENLLPDLPDTLFLRRGENPVAKIRKPKPFPADILERIDRMIADPEVDFPDGVRLMLRLFRASGPRATEALTLKRDSISFIEGRGYTLEYLQTKTQELRTIPLPDKLGEDLVAQSISVQERLGSECDFLFPYEASGTRNVLRKGLTQFFPWPYAKFTTTLWDLYRKHDVTKSALSGEVLTGAQVHRFRHTIATGLLNEGWSQYEVQTFLGHKTPTMMQAYAEIHDDKLREKYIDFVENSVDASGAHTSINNDSLDVERLRDRLTRSTLADGYCTLSEKLSCDFLPSPCLSCAFFRTTPKFLPIHIRRRDEALVEIDLAKGQGRTRATQAHEQTVEKLDVIIAALQEDSRELN